MFNKYNDYRQYTTVYGADGPDAARLLRELEREVEERFVGKFEFGVDNELHGMVVALRNPLGGLDLRIKCFLNGRALVKTAHLSEYAMVFSCEAAFKALAEAVLPEVQKWVLTAACKAIDSKEPTK